jgi:hypothetical protein
MKHFTLNPITPQEKRGALAKLSESIDGWLLCVLAAV